MSFIRVYSDENVLNSAMLKKHVFGNAPKEWLRYITKHLQIQLDKRHFNVKKMYFFLRSKQLEIEDYNSISLKKWKTLIYPLGFIRMNSEENPRYPIFRIQFFLDAKLRLNLTFHLIHLEFRHLYNCAVGEIRVISEVADKYQNFKYCGIHSNMINYPQTRYVYLYLIRGDETKSSKATIYNVTIFFSVIDTKRIVTLEKYRLLLRNLVWNLHLPSKNIRVMKFELKTEKYQNLIIKFTNDTDLMIEIFDGPGTHCKNIFKKSKESYVTSTFQSILYIWVSYMRKLNKECGFQFLTNISSISKNLKLNGSLQHTISHTNIKHKVWKIYSYYNVNLTIINLTYTGFNDPLCTFAGISLYNLNNNSYNELTTQCTSDSSIFAHRDIYSKSNETLLVLYDYKAYGSLNLTMQISTTKCKPVTINTCALTYLCEFKNNIMCKEHRKQIKSLSLKQSKIDTDFPVSVNPGKCFIFQIVAVTDRLWGRLRFAFDCKINFRHVNVLDRNVDIHFNIKAFIQSKYIHGL